MEAAHRGSLARPAPAVRPLKDLLRPAGPLAPRRTWHRLLAHAQTTSDAVGELEWVDSVDSTSVRAHQHAAGARKRAAPADTNKGIAHDPVEALGRSRGGLTTKLHLGCDGKGRPLGVVLTGGQRHDSTQLQAILDAICVPRPARRGRRPRKRPDHLVGDKADSYPRCRRLLRRRGIADTIPQRSDQRARRASRPGRPLAFDRARSRARHVVERYFNRLKQFRAVATRFENRAVNYRAMMVIASLLIWLDDDLGPETP